MLKQNTYNNNTSIGFKFGSICESISNVITRNTHKEKNSNKPIYSSYPICDDVLDEQNENNTNQNSKISVSFIIEHESTPINNPLHKENNINISHENKDSYESDVFVSCDIAGYNADKLREIYLSVIYEDESNWKKLIREKTDPIFERLIAANNVIVTDFVHNVNISIACDNRLKIFNTNKNSCVTIGRSPDCDIKTPPFPNISRVHALLYSFPYSNMYIIVDIGSLSGIETVYRSSGKTPISSFTNNRNVLFFDWEEMVILLFGDSRITINPKDCVICLENPRDTTFTCGHHIACSVCSQNLHKCPQCKTIIKHKKSSRKKAK